MEQLFDIADSTDWLKTSLPAFAPLESALRCQVCKDFYDTPMITSCSHTFCSLCIRKCLSSDGKCPACRANDQASKLRRNWTVQEIVDAFQTARLAALELARRDSTLARAKEVKKRDLKRKLDDTDLEEEEAPTRSKYRVTRSQTRRAATTATTSSQTQEVVISSQEDDYVDQEPDDGLVGCPICGTRMKEEAVYTHLDRCDGEKKQSNGRNTRAKSVHMPSLQPHEANVIADLHYLPLRLIHCSGPLHNNQIKTLSDYRNSTTPSLRRRRFERNCRSLVYPPGARDSFSSGDTLSG